MVLSGNGILFGAKNMYYQIMETHGGNQRLLLSERKLHICTPYSWNHRVCSF